VDLRYSAGGSTILGIGLKVEISGRFHSFAVRLLNAVARKVFDVLYGNM